MDLKELMARFGDHSERLPEDQIESGREINLTELTHALDAWQRVWDKLDPQTVNQRRYHEQREHQRDLKRQAGILRSMTFQLEAVAGYSKEFIRGHLLVENPEHEHLIKELFRPDAWCLLIAYTKARDGSIILDFCHTNTRKIARLKVSANSPIIGHFRVVDPAIPRGNLIIF